MRPSRILIGIILCTFISHGWLYGQIPDQEASVREQQSELPQAVNFIKLFEQKDLTKEEFENWKRQRDALLRERLSNLEAFEGAIDPETYIVGPGDVFSFNIWGAMEKKIPASVSPEGMLLIPSVGGIDVTDMTLAEVKETALKKAAENYTDNTVTLTLDILRLIRVHVVGEVRFPGTYITQAVSRISEMIVEAGGLSDRAWKRGIMIRHADGTESIFDLAAFEQTGDLSQDIFVNGGDVIHVPPIGIGNLQVQVEADQENSGIYQILPGEELLDFLQRIRALKRNSDLSKIMVIRANPEEKSGVTYLTPFENNGTWSTDFELQNEDRVILPSHYVYVKGAVRIPGAYPYVFNLTAKEYAGMAGADFRSGKIQKVRVYHSRTGKTDKGANRLVEPGDVVHVDLTWDQKFGNYLRIISAMTSLILAAEAAGVFN